MSNKLKGKMKKILDWRLKDANLIWRRKKKWSEKLKNSQPIFKQKSERKMKKLQNLAIKKIDPGLKSELTSMRPSNKKTKKLPYFYSNPSN
jgi:hypothetical protein